MSFAFLGKCQKLFYAASFSEKGAAKGGKGGKGGKEALLEEGDSPPPPLQLKVSFEMEAWKSAKDCPVKADGL